jgi:hypothetical protein
MYYTMIVISFIPELPIRVALWTFLISQIVMFESESLSDAASTTSGILIHCYRLTGRSTNGIRVSPVENGEFKTMVTTNLNGANLERQKVIKLVLALISINVFNMVKPQILVTKPFITHFLRIRVRV